jgi:hypothetical protein
MGWGRPGAGGIKPYTYLIERLCPSTIIIAELGQAQAK